MSKRGAKNSENLFIFIMIFLTMFYIPVLPVRDFSITEGRLIDSINGFDSLYGLFERMFKESDLNITIFCLIVTIVYLIVASIITLAFHLRFED